MRATKKNSNKYNASVIRATQSPMNKDQWECELSCGRSLWRKLRKRPVGTIACTLCAAAPILAALNKGAK